MNLAEASEGRFEAYVAALADVIGHRDRARPLHDYCVGLVMPGERKSVEPMAAKTSPGRTAAQHQSLLHFVGQGPWLDEPVLAKVREIVLPAIERHGPIEAWIIDDTSFPKQGRHSVGVAHQYCGELGKQANCQVAVSLSLANAHASLPVAYRLYLPKHWAEDWDRRRKAGVPAQESFKTKLQIALEQIRWALKVGLPRGTVLLDAGYGHDSKLRRELSELGLTYVAGILPDTLVWRPGREPRGAPRKGRRDEPDVVAVKEIARSLPAQAWRTIKWREGTNAWLSSRFARIRICVASAHAGPNKPAEEWLLIEWPKGETEPNKYWLSTLPQDIGFSRLVDLAKLRWRIERDYQELKQEIGLGHFEGRSWRGFHHHATLCIAAYGFLISEQETIPPSRPRRAALRQTSPLSQGHRSQEAAAQDRAPRSQLDSDPPPPPRRGSRPNTIPLSLLHPNDRAKITTPVM